MPHVTGSVCTLLTAVCIHTSPIHVIRTVSYMLAIGSCGADRGYAEYLENLDDHRPPQHHTTTVLRPLFRDHPGEPLPEENFWTLWCKGITEADSQTQNIRLGATPSGVRTNQCQPPPSPIFLQAGCPSCRPANSVKAQKKTEQCGRAVSPNVLPAEHVEGLRSKVT